MKNESRVEELLAELLRSNDQQKDELRNINDNVTHLNKNVTILGSDVNNLGNNMNEGFKTLGRNIE